MQDTFTTLNTETMPHKTFDSGWRLFEIKFTAIIFWKAFIRHNIANLSNACGLGLQLNRRTQILP